jgi:hypothetical protein
LWALGIGARIAARQGRGARAGVIWGSIEAEVNRAPAESREQVRGDFTEELVSFAGDQFDSGLRRGRSMSFDAAIDFALSDLE